MKRPIKINKAIFSFYFLFPLFGMGQGIEIQSGASIVNIGATTIEIINGSFINDGTYTKGNETFTLTGNTAGLISGNEISDFYDLVISNTGGIGIEYNSGVTASNSLNIANGASLTLNSNASGTGSLIINGTLSNYGNVFSERYFPGAVQAWHMLSAPMNGMAISASGFDPGSEDSFYAWDEPSPGIWVNYKNTTTSPTFTEVNGGDNFVSGKGYLVAYYVIDPTYTFTGTPNAGNVDFNLKNSSAKAWTYAAGWNLMGNPYTSAIDWNLATKSQFQDEFAYVYDPNKVGGEGYVPIDGSLANACISANQGFFVIAEPTANNQIFTFTKAIQTHGNIDYMKSEDMNDELVLRLSSENYFDETQIRVKELSDYKRDRYDALKIYSFNQEVPQVFSQSTDNVSLCVNSVPMINAGSTVRLSMLIPSDGMYTLAIKDVGSYLVSNGIFIEDKLSGNWHKLSESDYSFAAESGEVNDRFILHFGVVGIEESNIVDLNIPHVWQNKGQLFVQSITEIQMLEIFDVQGRLMMSKKVEGNEISISLNLPAGIYFVRVLNSTAKIIL